MGIIFMNETLTEAVTEVVVDGGFMHTLKSIDFAGIFASIVDLGINVLLTLLPYVEMAIPYVFPIFLAYSLYKLFFNHIYAYVMTQQVIGKSNEWVVIIRNGKQVTAGVGLSTFKRPFDNVATFPSSVKEVQFSAEQVTTEMQGINVSATLAWSIYREDDGPFRCYKTFGSDLKSNVPHSINDKLINSA